MTNRRTRSYRSLIPGPAAGLAEGKLSASSGGSATLEVFGGPVGAVADVLIDDRTVASVDLDALGSGVATMSTPTQGGVVTVVVDNAVLLIGAWSARHDGVER